MKAGCAVSKGPPSHVLLQVEGEVVKAQIKKYLNIFLTHKSSLLHPLKEGQIFCLNQLLSCNIVYNEENNCLLVFLK